MSNPQVSNPNDFKVVQFQNKEDFGFTPEMGCMYDGRPISGITGAPGINAGETITLPYHIGQRLATNLAKAAMVRRAPKLDPAGIPTGVPLWDSVGLDALKDSYITDLYTETKPIAMTETDRLMQKVEEYKKLVEQLVNVKTAEITAAPVTAPAAPVSTDATGSPYKDKQDVINELEVRGIKHDKRSTKANLELLLKPVA